MSAIFKRLPRNVLPKHYELELKPCLKSFTFEGKTSTHIKILSSTDNIVLNAVDLVISKAVAKVTGETQTATEITLCDKSETATLKFPKALPTGDGLLQLEFTGTLNDKMKGFYRSKYYSATGEERFGAVTQFEATDARRAFPCWDEPATKATFEISLSVPKDRVALSNMPIVSEKELEENLRLVKFDRTPIMSTYLVAVVVGEYDHVEGKSDDGVLVRVFTPVGKKEQGVFALEVATKVLPYYKQYFNIAYPLPKMDLIAISDFSAGAMENWGLVTYRESMILVDPENTSMSHKQSIALTVGHETAHQWFGNLVTMEWWTHLWLNEGYASFTEFLCVNKLFPEYDIWTQFVTDMYTRALDLDSLESSHPIEVEVNHPHEIDEIFDEISYNKGASIIRMLHHYLGDDDFRKGMHLYLTRHQYQNTKTEDLWNALSESSSKPVTQVMTTWIKQMGYPVISATSVPKGTKRVLTLRQSKFTSCNVKTNENILWAVPITISTAKRPNDIVYNEVMYGKELTVEIDDVDDDDWIKINPGTVGYFRTRYTPEMLRTFIPSIANGTLPPLDRLGLVDDLFALVAAGRAPTSQALELIEAYRNEKNYTVWQSITNAVNRLNVLISHTTLQSEYDKYNLRLFKPISDYLGWDPKPNESHLDVLLRSLVLNMLIACGDTAAIEEGKRRFELHANGKCLLPADLRSACYRAVVQNGDLKIYERMLSLYRKTDLHEEKDRISMALGRIRDVEILKKVVDFALSKEVRSQDSVFIIGSAAANRMGRDMCWEFFKCNSARLLKQYEGGFLLARLVKYLTENFASEEKAKEIEQFFREHEFPGTERTLSQSLETIRLNAAWLQRDLSNITDYLNTKSNVIE